MLYAILKPIVKLALRLYFGRIVVRGLENIDNGKPSIILANHTASFMDAIITACFIKRRIHFFTRGDVFSNGIVEKVLRSLGMLPVYRMMDGRDKLALNDHSNEEALKILSRGGAVLIFCEGSSDISKVLKPMKKGPFRLAVQAAATSGEVPVLVPLGINYVLPTEAFGDVFLNASEPISTASFEAATDADAARSATRMMRSIHGTLARLAWHLEEPSNVPTFEDLLAILGTSRPRYTFDESLALEDRLNAAAPQQIAALREDFENYRLWQRQHRVYPTQYLSAPKAWEWLFLIAGFPFAATGVIMNFTPLTLARAITREKVSHPDFKAAVFLSCAVLALFVWYLSWLFIWPAWTPSVGLILNPLTMALTGFFFLKIYRPAFRKAQGSYYRMVYPRANPSHKMVLKMYGFLESFVDRTVE